MTSSAAAYGELDMSLIAAARNGNLVLLSGAAVDMPGAKRPSPGCRPLRLARPTRPVRTGNAVLALDAADGQPRWSERGGEQAIVNNGADHTETFTLTDGAVCKAAPAGVLCLDNTTGALSFPALAASQVPYSIPLRITDRYAASAAASWP